MLQNWLKIYLYNNKKNKVYFFLTILCLAIGIGAVLLSTLYAKEEESFDRWNKNKNDVYFVENKNETVSLANQPFILSIMLKDQYPFVEDYFVYSGYTSNTIEYDKEKYLVDKIVKCNETFFDFFPYPLIYGSQKSIFQNPNEIVLEKDKAELLFGKNINPIGKQLKIEEQLYIVVGVYDLEGKRGSFMPEVILNEYQFLDDEQATSWGYSASSLLVKTNKSKETGAAIDSLYLNHYLKPLAAENGVLVSELIDKSKGFFNQTAILHPLPELHFEKSAAIVVPEAQTKHQFVQIVLGLSWVIFILSLFNYVNLLLSQALSRAKEVGVRKSLGGLNKDIIKQNLFETTLTICISFVVSIFFILFVLPFANSFLNTNIEVTITDFVVLFVGVFFLILLLAGLIPALYIAKYKTLSELKGNFHRSRSGSVIKNCFLIVQFAIACWFITGTYIVYKQVSFMTTKDVGFKGDQVISFSFLEQDWGTEKYTKYQVFKQEIKKIKGVEQVAIADLIYGAASGGTFSYIIHNDKNELVRMVNAEEEYFDMMGIELKEGRFLSTQFANDSIDNILINEAVLQAFDQTSVTDLVLNKQNVVGLLKNFHNTGLESRIQPMIFVLPSDNYNNFNQVNVKVNLDELEAVIPAIEKIWNSFNPSAHKTFSYEFVDKEFARSFIKIQTQREVMMYLSCIVTFIALFGLFAISSFNIGTKLKEIAIRKVLGADTKSLIQKLSIQYVVYCVAGFLLAFYPSYYLLNQWLSDYAYRIEIEYDIYVVCFFIMLLLALTIVVSRAYKATRVNVLEYIKYE